MNIQTKYEVNDIVYTIDTSTLKMKKIEIESVSIHVNNNGDSSVCYYGNDNSYTSYDEKKCFPSEKELLAHITSKTIDKVA